VDAFASRLSPRRTAERWQCLAEEYFQKREIRRALAYYQRAIELGTPAESLRERLWMCYMMLGEFESAWRQSDQVLEQRRSTHARCDHLPLHCRWVWNGSPLVGEAVLVRCYHGLGDTIQFLRYAPLLKQRCRSVTVEAEPGLAELAMSIAGVDRV
jgi:tetratricopeptide (TPR) repeat protein